MFESREKLGAFPLPPADSGYGILAINADPYAEDVVVNGVSYGPTPREIRVPAGTYRVRVTHSQLGEQTRPMQVHAGTRAVWVAPLMN